MEESGKQKYLRLVGFWTWSRINFLDGGKALKKEKLKLVIAHPYKTNIVFLRIFTQFVLQLYTFQDLKDTIASVSSLAMERSFEELLM